MPMAHVRLIPGTNTEQTPVLNTAGVVSSEGVRWWQGLPQKQGGWIDYYTATSFNPPPRDLMSLESLSGVGQTLVIANDRVRFLTGSTLTDITPILNFQTVARTSLTMDTTAGSSIVTINWTGQPAAKGDVITFNTMCAGPQDGFAKGVLLYGSYNVLDATTNSLTIETNRVYSSNNTAAPIVTPFFRTFVGNSLVEMSISGAFFAKPGDVIRLVVPTTLGGLTIQGDITVTINTDQLNLTTTVLYFRMPTNASSTASAYQGGGTISYAVSKPTVTGSVSGTAQTSNYWTLSPWGAAAVATAVGGRTYTTTLGSSILYPLAGAPVFSGGSFIAMPQQILVCWGASTNIILDPLTIKWSDVSDYNNWTASSINQAGSFRLPRGNRVVGCLQASQQAFIWTDLDAWAMQFIGDGFGFNLIGAGSGLMSRRAVAALDANIFWMGKNQFYVMTNGNIQTLPCTVWDAVFQNLNTSTAALDKVFCAPNIGFNEVSWYYCSAGSSEVDSRVTYNMENNAWTYEAGSEAIRYAWIDRSALGPPLAAAPGVSNSIIIQNETGYKAGTAQLPSKFRTGYWMVNESQNVGYVDMIYPDFIFGEFSGSQDVTLNLTFYSKMNVNDAPTVHGPYSYPNSKNFLSTRIRGRYIAMEVEETDSATDAFWRLGDIRFQIAQDGRR